MGQGKEGTLGKGAPRAKRSAVMAGLVLLTWFAFMLLLWSPGLGNVSVPHLKYFRSGYGVLSYYSVEAQDGRVLRRGLNPAGLAITLALTVVATALAARDLLHTRGGQT
jgi:hypothetical protein